MNKIITISREYGSGGNQIGKLLAKELNIHFYNREIIEKAAEESGMAEETFKKAGDKAGNKFLYSLYVSATTPMPKATAELHHMANLSYESAEELVFSAQSKIIKDYAAKGPCVIIGRGADYVLRDNPNLVTVFIWADIDYRIKRISKFEQIHDEKCREVIKKIDKRRKNYYNYHTKRKWSAAENYDLSLRSDLLGLKNSAEIIKNFVELLK